MKATIIAVAFITSPALFAAADNITSTRDVPVLSRHAVDNVPVTENEKDGRVYEEAFTETSMVANDVPFFFNYKGSNTNFTIDTQSPLNRQYYTYNYNRLRTDIDLGWENNVTFKVIWDLENYLGENYIRSTDFQTIINRDLNIPLAPYSTVVTGDTDTLRSYLYRAYSTVYLPSSALTLGFQRIPFGVGRIWNPTDTLNPPNPISIETGERMGVYGVHYAYDLSDLSDAQLFYTLDKDNRTLNWGGRLKTNIEKMDIGVSTIRNENIKMSGIELERELFATGIGIRTEAGHFENKPLNKEYDKYILGLDYAFPNSLYIVGEYLYNGNGELNKDDYDWTILSLGSWEQLAREYLGLTASYELTPLVILSGTYIQNLCDKSTMFGPHLKWSLADDADLSLGASLFGGDRFTEFWHYKAVHYISFGLYF